MLFTKPPKTTPKTTLSGIQITNNLMTTTNEFLTSTSEFGEITTTEYNELSTAEEAFLTTLGEPLETTESMTTPFEIQATTKPIIITTAGIDASTPTKPFGTFETFTATESPLFSEIFSTINEEISSTTNELFTSKPEEIKSTTNELFNSKPEETYSPPTSSSMPEIGKIFI